VNRTELGGVIRRERERLVGDLRMFPADAWDQPSLCQGWRVRDVVGHLIRNDEAFRRGYPLLVDLARAGFRPNTGLARAARRRAEGLTPDDLIDALAQTAYERSVRVHPTPTVPLGELLIHGQDMRRALGRPHSVPPESFALAARGALSPARLAFRWGRPPKGVRFEANDVAWSWGEGQTVRGPIEAIVMILARRAAALADLEGEGVVSLRSAYL
jgi:uncharacterized protein (TIGR03083 family)